MTQREAFEAWARDNHFNRTAFSRGQDLIKALPQAWEVWQAAQAQATNHWQKEVEEQVMITCDGPADWSNPKAMVDYLINYHVDVALDPRVSSDAQALLDQGKAHAQAAFEAIDQACNLAMDKSGTARMPECGDFAAIAQNLDFARNEMRTAQATDTIDALRSQVAYLDKIVEDQAQVAVELVTANNDEVICPKCCTQFRAIPVNVQQLMLDAGFEPPFKTDPAVEPMTEVADRFAHRMALELECVLSDGAYSDRWYKSAMQVLSEYRSAMNAIHERHSPTFMGEPVIEGPTP